MLIQPYDLSIITSHHIYIIIKISRIIQLVNLSVLCCFSPLLKITLLHIFFFVEFLLAKHVFPSTLLVAFIWLVLSDSSTFPLSSCSLSLYPSFFQMVCASMASSAIFVSFLTLILYSWVLSELCNSSFFNVSRIWYKKKRIWEGKARNLVQRYWNSGRLAFRCFIWCFNIRYEQNVE